MGLFSSKTRINVFSNAIPLIDEDYNSVADTIVGAILTDNDIAQSIIDNALTGASMNVHRMLNYARNDYTLGLAKGLRHTTTILDNTDVEIAITTDLSLDYGCLVDYNYVTALTIDLVVLPFLINQRGYNIATNQISVYPSGLNLASTYTVGNEKRPLGHKVTTHSATYNDDHTTATIRYKIVSSYTTVAWNDEGGRSITSHTLSATYFDEDYTLNPGMRIGRPYCIAKYFELDSGFQKIEANNWWFYDITTDLYPNINPTYSFDAEDSFFPVIPIRYNNVDYTAPAKYTTDLYKTSKILLNRIGIDINELGDTINDNPDVGEIDHAYVMYGVNLQSNNKESLRYLIEFFDFLYDEVTIKQNNFINFRLNDALIQQTTYGFNSHAMIAPSGATAHIEYSDSDYENTPYIVAVTNSTTAASLVEHGLDTAIDFSYISSIYKNGSIGTVGTVTKTLVNPTGGYGSNKLNEEADNSKLILRYQETVGTYKEVVVVGLRHVNRIYGDYAVITNIADIIANSDNDNFIIPMHLGISKRLPLSTRNNLYHQALHIVINGVTETKVRWYERGMFKFITMVITFIVAIWSGNWWLVPAYMAMEVLTQIASPRLMIVIKIAYIAYAIYSMNWGELAEKGMSTAAYLLGMVSAIVDLSTIPMSIKLLDTMDEMEDLAIERETVTKELEEAQEALDTSSFLNAGLLLDAPRLTSIPNENPTAFFTRTLQNNAGLLALDIVQNYHTALLQLPEPDYNSAFGIT